MEEGKTDFRTAFKKNIGTALKKFPKKLHFKIGNMASKTNSIWNTSELLKGNVLQKCTHSLTLRVTTILPFKHKIERMSAFFTAWVNKALYWGVCSRFTFHKLQANESVLAFTDGFFGAPNHFPRWIINVCVPSPDEHKKNNMPIKNNASVSLLIVLITSLYACLYVTSSSLN